MEACNEEFEVEVGKVAYTLGAAALATTLAVVGANSASATTSPTDEYRPVLPVDAGGVLGNPTNIVSGGTPDQVVTIPSGAAAGTQLKNAPADGWSNQTWYFAAVGTIPFDYTYQALTYGMPMVTLHLEVSVRRIINKQSDNKLCLEASGSRAVTQGTAVDFSTCGASSQSNQLWVAAGPSLNWSEETPTGSNDLSSSRFFPQVFSGHPDHASNVLVNYASVVANKTAGTNAYNWSNALVLSGAQIIRGADSPLSLRTQGYPVANELWGLRDMNSAPTGGSPSAPIDEGTQPAQPHCTGYECLINVGQ